MAEKKKHETKAEYKKRMKWFSNAGLGVFIHWGLYSLLGHGEWAQWRENIHPGEYTKLVDKFNPKKFDAKVWAKLIKNAGARYAVFTTRHHDGFSLWDSKVSDYTSVKTRTKRDFVAEYVQAARDQGLKVGLYYSLMDWSWPAFNIPSASKNSLAWQTFAKKGPAYNPAAWKNFIGYVHQQVRELMTNYGKIDLLFYDGSWFIPPKDWKSNQLNAMVRSLQPHIVINDRDGTKGDYDTPENELPLHIEPQHRPWEACFCMNDTWGYIPGDKNYKTLRQCLYALLRIRGAGGNFLLNTSPKPNGEMPAQNTKILIGLGNWLAKNGESIYGCSLARMAPHGTGYYSQPGLVTTHPDKNAVYYHVLRWLGDNNHCTKIDAQITSANFLHNGRKVNYRQDGPMVYFTGLPCKAPDELDTVIKMTYKPNTAKSTWTKTFV